MSFAIFFSIYIKANIMEKQYFELIQESPKIAALRNMNEKVKERITAKEEQLKLIQISEGIDNNKYITRLTN